MLAKGLPLDLIQGSEPVSDRIMLKPRTEIVIQSH
jgi:hypothetical protein